MAKVLTYPTPFPITRSRVMRILNDRLSSFLMPSVTSDAREVPKRFNERIEVRGRAVERLEIGHWFPGENSRKGKRATIRGGLARIKGGNA